MKKLKMAWSVTLTFEEGCNKYLENCRQRNLREGTINHYRQSYVQFEKFFDMQMPVSDLDEKMYQKYVVFLRETLHNDVSINSYLRDFITTFHFLMNEGYVEEFQMKAIKVDDAPVDTYTEDELRVLLKKPNMKKCTYAEYRNWVVTNLFFQLASDNEVPFFLKLRTLILTINIFTSTSLDTVAPSFFIFASVVGLIPAIAARSLFLISRSIINLNSFLIL